jgi:hypothetical protein
MHAEQIQEEKCRAAGEKAWRNNKLSQHHNVPETGVAGSNLAGMGLRGSIGPESAE